MKKTKGLYIGSWKKKRAIFTDIKWVQSVNELGTEFGYNINYEEIWMKKFTKFKTTVMKWSKRNLTF